MAAVRAYKIMKYVAADDELAFVGYVFTRTGIDAAETLGSRVFGLGIWEVQAFPVRTEQIRFDEEMILVTARRFAKRDVRPRRRSRR